MRELTSVTTFDRYNIKVVIGVGLCGTAVAFSTGAAAAPLKTGGYACVQGAAGEVGAPAVVGGPVVAAVCVPPAPAGAPIAEMGGAPAAAPVAG
ncbi:MAG: beta-xylosidase, partial [Mycobacterium sp.]